MPSSTAAPPTVQLDAREAQIAGAAIRTMLRFHSIAAAYWSVDQLEHVDELDALARRLAPEFDHGPRTANTTREQDNVAEALSLTYGQAAIRHCDDGSGDVIVCGLTDDIELATYRVAPDGERTRIS